MTTEREKWLKHNWPRYWRKLHHPLACIGNRSDLTHEEVLALAEKTINSHPAPTDLKAEMEKTL